MEESVNEEDTETALGSIGFMFDAEAEKETRIIQFQVQSSSGSSNVLEVHLKTLGDQPGHVQSGHYLWPAAQAAAQYLISSMQGSTIQKINDVGFYDYLEEHHLPPCDTILELGAGCGLTGLAVAQLSHVRRVIFTDYDPGSLQLLNDNISLNKNCNSEFSVHFLEWGKKVEHDVRLQHSYPKDGFQLIIGADLIYSIDVIQPLFHSVSELLDHSVGDDKQCGSTFVLTSSFALNSQYDAEIDAVCASCGLKRILIIPLDEMNQQCKIEYFQPMDSIT